MFLLPGSSQGAGSPLHASNVLRQLLRQLVRPILIALGAAAQQDHHHPAAHRIVEPVTRPVIDPQLAHTIVDGLPVTQQPRLDPPDTLRDLPLRFLIAQPIEPALELLGALDAILCRLYTTYWLRSQ